MDLQKAAKEIEQLLKENAELKKNNKVEIASEVSLEKDFEVLKFHF